MKIIFNSFKEMMQGAGAMCELFGAEVKVMGKQATQNNMHPPTPPTTPPKKDEPKANPKDAGTKK